MLPKKNRLKSRKDFSRLFSKGKVVSGKSLMIKHVSNGLGYPRVGFVVSTKVSKKAVYRNRLKRRMREVVREMISEIAAGSDIAVIARPGALNMTYGEISQELGGIFRKSGMFPKEEKK